MQSTKDSPVIRKTRELCQLILEQPEFESIKQKMNAFMADQTAQQQYEGIRQKGEDLHNKQHEGKTLSPGEVADFEQLKEKFVNSTAGRNFLEAQDQMHEVQDSIHQYVAKTLQLGRVPTPDDFESDSCGHGCGCHH